MRTSGVSLVVCSSCIPVFVEVSSYPVGTIDDTTTRSIVPIYHPVLKDDVGCGTLVFGSYQYKVHTPCNNAQKRRIQTQRTRQSHHGVSRNHNEPCGNITPTYVCAIGKLNY